MLVRPVAALPLLILLLVLATPSRAQDWLRSLGTGVGDLARRLDAPKAAPIERPDLYGRPFRLAELSGRVVVLSFLDRDAVDEAVTWLERQTTWMLDQEGLAFVNVFHPGGISFLVPRGEAVARLRSQVDRVHRDLSAGLDPGERARLDRLDIRWIIDWDRRLARRYPVERGRVNLFLLDRDGRIQEVLRYDPEAPVDGLQKRVVALLGHAPEGGDPPGEGKEDL